MDFTVLIFLILTVCVVVLLWIYEHPPKNKGKRTGRGGDFD